MRFSLTNSAVMAVISILILGGCYGDTSKSAGKAAPRSGRADSQSGEPQTKMDAHEGEDHSTGPELSPTDQALADQQKVCPVSDEELGGMGPPIKLVVKGEPVFICCKGCEKKVNADPDKYLAKVAQLKKVNPN
jgi:hypothetical protein